MSPAEMEFTLSTSYNPDDARRAERTVWVTNKVGVSYDTATEFGSLAYITQGPIGGLTYEQMSTLAEVELAAAGADDWILPSGSMAISVIAAIHMFAEFGVVNLLLWDTVLKEYQPFTIHGNRT